MPTILPHSWSRDNAIERRERVRRAVSVWVVWAVGVLLALAHAGVPAIVGIEVTEHPDGKGFLVGLGSLLAIFGSHVLSLVGNLLAIPPLLASCFSEEHASGAGDALCLTTLSRPTILLGKLRPRLEPLVWAALAQAVFVTVATLIFELWWGRKDPDDAAPPLGAITSLLWSFAAVAAPAAASLWAGLRFRTVGKAVAVAYLASGLALSLAGGLATVVGALVDASMTGPAETRVMLVLVLSTLCASAAALLYGSVWLLAHCVTRFDDMLAGGAD